MVDFLRAFDFRRVMWVVARDSECELEAATFVHALVGLDCECEVEDVVWIVEVCSHSLAER